jgi:hypothetical protein
MSLVKGVTMNINWNEALYALVLIRIGQDLGTNSPAARAVHDMIELLVAVASGFCR